MRRWTLPLLLLVAMPTASFLLVWAWPEIAPSPEDDDEAPRSATAAASTSPDGAIANAPIAGPADHPAGTPDAAPSAPATPPGHPAQAASNPTAAPSPELDAADLAALRELHAGQRDAFDAALADWQTGRQPQAGPLPPVETPTLPAPAASAEPGSLAVSWDEYDSVIEVSDAPPDAEGRRSAKVTTFDRQGKELVNYQAQAYRSADGKLVIDARGAAIAGPWARFWSPDSFTVDDDLQVTTIDDLHRRSDGSGAPADGG